MGVGAELLLKSPDCSPPVAPGCRDPRWLAEHGAEVVSAGGLFFLSLHTGVCSNLLRVSPKSVSRLISLSSGKLTLLQFAFSEILGTVAHVDLQPESLAQLWDALTEHENYLMRIWTCWGL